MYGMHLDDRELVFDLLMDSYEQVVVKQSAFFDKFDDQNKWMQPYKVHRN